MRFELGLIAVFGGCWLLAMVSTASGFPWAGLLPFNLYFLYSLAAALGWVGGNVYVHRTRELPGPFRRRLAIVYLAGPLGPLYLLHTLVPNAARTLVPLAPVYAFGVFLVFFLVPVTLRRSAR